MMKKESLSVVLTILCIVATYISMANGAAMQFTLPKNDVIVCTDSMENICTAPTSCNKNGKVALDTGNNFNVGGATQDNGVWLIIGGYTIDFPSICNVTCQGNCTCKTCDMIEVEDFITTDDNESTSSASSNHQFTVWASMFLFAVFTVVYLF
jgi:hypothetical protein